MGPVVTATAKPRRLRCRWQVWGGGRAMTAAQCWYAASAERMLRIRAHRGADGVVIPARVELLPVCGTHARTYDRRPDSAFAQAYAPDLDAGHWVPQVAEYVR